MRRAGAQGAVGAALAGALLCACRTPPRKAPVAAPAALPRHREPPVPPVSPQPGKVIAEVNGIAVLALSLPGFEQLPRDQRLLALEVAQAGAAGEAAALDQTFRDDLALVHVLHGILRRPLVVPAVLLPRIRAFARLVWLNGGLHDAQTGRKQAPPFTAADLRTAALAAQAAGADFRFGPVSLELALRALEPALFDPGVDPVRTPRSAGAPRVVPSAAAMLDRALSHAAPPQGAVLESLASFLHSGDPQAYREAQGAWVEAAGAVDFFAGFFDSSMLPRGSDGIFGAFAGVRDPGSGAPVQRLAEIAARLGEKLPWAERREVQRPAVAEALFLAAASGALRPLREFALTLPIDPAQRAAGVKTAVFAGAAEAVGRIRDDAAVRALADPASAAQLAPCLPQLRLASLALQKLGTATPIFIGETKIGVAVPLFEDLVAQVLAADPLAVEAGLLDESCQRLWPQFAAASLLASLADVPQGNRVDSDSSRAHQLELWWFTSRGALVLRSQGPRHFLAVPDASRFHAVARELLQLVHSGSAARLDHLVQLHAAHLDPGLRDEVLERLRAAGIPRRVAVIPPRLLPVLEGGKPDDARAAPVDDLDAEILREWDGL